MLQFSLIVAPRGCQTVVNSPGGPPGVRYSAVEMCKWVLIAILVAFVALMAVAALVVQEYGWPGFLAFLVGLVVLGYVLRLGLPPLFMYLITRPMRQMGAALRGARIVVHAVTPCDPPPEEEWEGDPSDDDDDDYRGRRLTDRRRRDDEDEADDDEDEEDEDEGDEGETGPLDWYQIELTVEPPDGGSIEGRIVTRHAWSPQLIGAAGPRPPGRPGNRFRGWPPGDEFDGAVQHAEIELWTGSDYEPPDDQVYGRQRLRLRVGVTREVRTVTITYAHFTDIGEVRLPRIDVSPGRGS